MEARALGLYWVALRHFGRCHAARGPGHLRLFFQVFGAADPTPLWRQRPWSGVYQDGVWESMLADDMAGVLRCRCVSVYPLGARGVMLARARGPGSAPMRHSHSCGFSAGMLVDVMHAEAIGTLMAAGQRVVLVQGSLPCHLFSNPPVW